MLVKGDDGELSTIQNVECLGGGDYQWYRKHFSFLHDCSSFESYRFDTISARWKPPNLFYRWNRDVWDWSLFDFILYAPMKTLQHCTSFGLILVSTETSHNTRPIWSNCQSSALTNLQTSGTIWLAKCFVKAGAVWKYWIGAVDRKLCILKLLVSIFVPPPPDFSHWSSLCLILHFSPVVGDLVESNMFQVS